MDGKQYDGPVLKCCVTKAPDGTYAWEVALSAADHSGTRKLGYKAEGTLTDLASVPGTFEISVHDEDRPVWTPMPLSHRADIRKSIESLLAGAAATLKACKHI